jgi:hypothetical protein
MRRAALSLVIGLAAGILLGLMVGYVISPLQIVDNPMQNLSPRYKDEYTVMVAAGYRVDRDLQTAINRLAALNVPNVFQYVRDVTERYISQQGTGAQNDIRVLVNLSCDLGYCSEAMQPFRIPPSASGSGG